MDLKTLIMNKKLIKILKLIKCKQCAEAVRIIISRGYIMRAL